MTKKPYLIALTAGVLSIALVGYAQAAGPGPRGEGRFMEFRFDELDQNKDGFITKQEAEARQSERFAKVDADNDGKLSLAEIRQSREQRHEEMKQKRFSMLDADNSGTVSPEEFSKGSAEHMSRRSKGRFSRMDKNDDGVLTLDEIGSRRRR